MELLVIRHAKAEDHGLRASDRDRELVEKGYKQCGRLATGLKNADLIPEIILTSPVVRAFQTADMLVDELGGVEVIECGWLRCGMHPEHAVEELAAYNEFGRVAIVGHQPDLGGLISMLIEANGECVRVRKASVTVIEEFFPPSWTGVLKGMWRF